MSPADSLASSILPSDLLSSEEDTSSHLLDHNYALSPYEECFGASQSGLAASSLSQKTSHSSAATNLDFEGGASSQFSASSSGTGLTASQRLSRDERKAKKLGLPFLVTDIIDLPIDAFNELLTRHTLTEDQLMLCRDIRRRGKNKELIDQKKLVQLYGPELKQGSKDSPPTSVFNEMSEEGRKRWDDLKNRVVEHNIRIMAKYYTKVTLKRMSELLDLKVDETEDFLSKMVVDKSVEAKVDRLDGIVHFSRNQDPNEMLNDWSHNISDLMGLVMKTTHLINREEMVHKHMAGLKID